jgi:hypothetical protein
MDVSEIAGLEIVHCCESEEEALAVAAMVSLERCIPIYKASDDPRR